MKKIIIFDFLRTLFDPDTDTLVLGAREVLTRATALGFTLCLISQREGGEREKKVHVLGLERYFDRLVFCDKKTPEAFDACIQGMSDVDRSKSFVVGDRVRGEIACGNACGLQTIWVRNGKFADELPEIPEEQPTFCVGSLKEILPILERSVR